MTDSNTFLNSEGKKEAASYFLSDFPKRRKQKVSCVSLGYTSGSCWRGSAEGWRLSSVAGQGRSLSSCKNSEQKWPMLQWLVRRQWSSSYPYYGIVNGVTEALGSTPDTWCRSASRCSGAAPRSAAIPYPCLGSGIGCSASILLLVVLDLALKLKSSCLFSWECVLKWTQEGRPGPHHLLCAEEMNSHCVHLGGMWSVE